MADFQINTVVICDDIRREISHKDILVGVYGSEIVVHSLPIQLQLAFWLELQVKKSGHFELFLQIEAPNSAPRFEFRLNLEVLSNRLPFGIFTPQVNVPVEREGKLRLWTKSNETAKYELIKTRNMRYEPPGSSPQPAKVA